MAYSRTLNIKGELINLSRPLVMGILNVTPDSFYSGSRKQTEADIDRRIQTILEEGGDLIDVGGYSSRPGAEAVSLEEEIKRLTLALGILQKHYPSVPVSVDTFRSEAARISVETYGAALINDISAGEMDPQMFDTVASLRVPYIIMHMRGTPDTMQQHTDYTDMMDEIFLYFSSKVRELHARGVDDIIIDPGFGFSKTLDQNYILMDKLSEFTIFDLPLLVGISRKSMIYKLLGGTPEESLEGTVVLNTVALLNGADILRVHDVKAAADAVGIITKLKQTR